MKKVFSFFALAAIVLSMGLSSCAKEDPANALSINTERTGTISGSIVMDSDLKPNTDDKLTLTSPPSGYKISATVTYASLTGNDDAKGVYTITDITYDSSKGIYTINAPVGVDGSEITIIFDDIFGTQNQMIDKLEGKPIFEVKKGKWSTAGAEKETLFAGQTIIRNALKLDFKESEENGSLIPNKDPETVPPSNN